MKNEKEYRCKICKRTVDGGGKYGICPSCINKYGSPVLALIAAGGIGLGGLAMKDGGKIIKEAVKAFVKLR